MRIRDNARSSSRLNRYVEEKVVVILEKMENNDFQGSYVMWGIDILDIYNRGIEKVKEKGISCDSDAIKVLITNYVIGVCIGILEVKLDVYIGVFGKEVVEKMDVKETLEMSAIELYEIYLYISKTDSLDVLTNCAGVVRDMQLVEFGGIKVYVELVQDGLLPIEVAAERLGIIVDKVKRIIEKGMILDE